jgi:hypothetical protein
MPAHLPPVGEESEILLVRTFGCNHALQLVEDEARPVLLAPVQKE